MQIILTEIFMPLEISQYVAFIIIYSLGLDQCSIHAFLKFSPRPCGQAAFSY